MSDETIQKQQPRGALSELEVSAGNLRLDPPAAPAHRQLDAATATRATPDPASATPAASPYPSYATEAVKNMASSQSRSAEAAKQLLCGGVAGSVAKTVTAPFSRLTILFQVHSMVTTKEHRPRFAMTLKGGVQKIIERGGIRSMWKGNMTSVLHRFPYSAINFFVYENALDYLSEQSHQHKEKHALSAQVPQPRGSIPLPPLATRRTRPMETNETPGQLIRRVSKIVMKSASEEGEDESHHGLGTNSGSDRHSPHHHGHHHKEPLETTQAWHKFVAGAMAGTAACLACYPLDLIRTRLTTELEGQEHYRGLVDAFRKISTEEGIRGFYSGAGATLFVAVPSFAISYTVYGTLKEYTLDDELFYNLRRIDADSGEEKLGFGLTILCGAASGILATLVTFPMDTIRRRMQIQNLHVPVAERLSSRQQFYHLVTKEGLGSLYRGLTPELLKVIPMVGTLFVVYETTKDMLDV
jgi:Mitochondrial carrier protein